MKIAPVHRNNSYASPSRKSGRANSGRSWHANQYADGSHNLHRWAIMGERRAYTDTYNCGDSFTDWTLLQEEWGACEHTYY